MVHAFIVHTLRCCGRSGDEAPPCRVLYSRVFSPERPEGGGGGRDPEKDRLAQKERILAVARQVDSSCKLHLQAAGRPSWEPLALPPEDPAPLQDAPSGAFRLPPGDPFPLAEGELTVLWLGVHCVAFALVCGPQENLLLAEGTLRSVARSLLDHLRLLGSGSDVLLKAERTEVVLGRFLPHGQLLFLNDQFVAGMEREVAAALGK
nr:AP-5 complex subunit sigma-1 [Anolis sagrei ordinatus]